MIHEYVYVYCYKRSITTAADVKVNQLKALVFVPPIVSAIKSTPPDLRWGYVQKAKPKPRQTNTRRHFSVPEIILPACARYCNCTWVEMEQSGRDIRDFCKGVNIRDHSRRAETRRYLVNLKH